MDAAREQVNGTTAGHCPTCHRYVGPASTCPFCDSPTDRPLRLTALRIVAILLALGGLALLHMMAMHRDLPVIAVEDMTPAMNFAYIRIIGRVAAEPAIYRKYGRIHRVTITIDDGTGTIGIAAYEKRARELVNSGLPREGETVEVEGALSMRNGRQPRIYIDAPRQVRTPLTSRGYGETACTR